MSRGVERSSSPEPRYPGTRHRPPVCAPGSNPPRPFPCRIRPPCCPIRPPNCAKAKALNVRMTAASSFLFISLRHLYDLIVRLDAAVVKGRDQILHWTQQGNEVPSGDNSRRPAGDIIVRHM